jgi:hypothetical protein
MKLILERWNRFCLEQKLFEVVSPITGKSFQMPEEIYEGTGNDWEEDGVVVKNIPMNLITMLKRQGETMVNHINTGRLTMTDGLPVLWYDLDKEQLIIDDGNHRIFGKWLNGENTFDAIVYSSNWHPVLRSVYGDEEIFDWSDDYR